MAKKQSDPPPGGANSAASLLSCMQRIETLDEEISEARARQKDEMEAIKSMGFDTKIVRKVLARRKRKADDIAEEEALIETYERALESAAEAAPAATAASAGF